jgi:riboflavin kinase/FMN adenylyltransferase
MCGYLYILTGFANFVDKFTNMIIHEGYEDLDFKNPIVTLGFFDGVHRGHQFLLKLLVDRAKETAGESVIVTLYPHPRQVLSDNTDLTFLTSLDEKKVLLEKANIDRLIIVPFTHEFSNKEACEFIKEILVEKIGMKHLIVGFNHHFGRGGRGNFNTISDCATKYKFRLEKVHGISSTEGNISSTMIREALLTGQLEKATQLLGYNYFMNGIIVEGKQFGRSIGFPTANIEPDYINKLIPKSGVYAVELVHEGSIYKGMVNIGTRPTVNTGSEPMSIEVHLFDFMNNIYNNKITLVFRYRMRDEIKFDGLERLIEQLKKDREQALKLLRST